MKKQNLKQEEQVQKEVNEKYQEFCIRTDACATLPGEKHNTTFRLFPNGDAAFYRCGCAL